MRVTILDYQPEWPALFRQEEALLARTLAEFNPVIEHVGSTSVPGLAAKPIIDILVGLPDFSVADSVVGPMTSAGYLYEPKYEDVMPYRRYFQRNTGKVRTHHIHMVVHGGTFWRRHTMFRDYLRAHPEAVAGYAALKRSLAEREWSHMNEYANAKTDFIREVERLAGIHDGTIDERD
jgi:GrpB-like predicted nucleotidyltransferase (UPF0157 family)